MVQAWLDNSGLYQKYGVDQTTTSSAGEYRNNGQLREIEFKIDLTTLTETETILDDNVFIPKGMRIAEVKVLTHTAATTGAAIDVGLIKTDRATPLAYTAILNTFATSSMNADGETTIVNTVASGAGGVAVGATTADVYHVTASRTSATAFGAGIIYVTIKYYRP